MTKAFDNGFGHGREEAAHRKATMETVKSWDPSRPACELALNCDAYSLAEILGVEVESVKAIGFDYQTALNEYDRGHRAGAIFGARAN